MYEKRAMMFAAFALLLLALGIAFGNMFGANAKHILLLLTAGLIVPAALPLFSERPDINTVLSAAIISIALVWIINDNMYAGTVLKAPAPYTALIFVLLFALFIPLMELRERLFKGDSRAIG